MLSRPPDSDKTILGGIVGHFAAVGPSVHFDFLPAVDRNDWRSECQRMILTGTDLPAGTLLSSA